MTETPSLNDLRAKVFKHCRPGGREIGNWLAVRWGRPSAVYGTWLAVRWGLSAHAVTAMALGSALMAAVGIGSGSRVGFVLGVLLVHLAYWLDHVDGQVARWRGTASLTGVYFDYMFHHLWSMTIGFALGFGLVMRGESPLWAVSGFILSVGWTCLGLNHDCRYKAFFQRLKVETGRFVVEGGSGGRPEPPTGWPRRWPGIVSWPLAKVSEPHVVLMILTALGGLSVVSAEVWLAFWRGYVLSAGLVAVLLVAARMGRAIACQAVDREYDRWFRPVSTCEARPSGFSRLPSTTTASASMGSSRP